MRTLKKHFLFVLLILSTGLFAASGVSAQTWTAHTPGGTNPCMPTGTSSLDVTINPGKSGTCQCPTGYTYGLAQNANCTLDGFLPGCWNPGPGTCNTCGDGGTIILGGSACFNSGQSNSGTYTSPSGVSCVGSDPASWSGQSAQCVSSDNTSGGYAQ